MQIFVKIYNGKIQCFEVERSNTIKYLKEKIGEKLGIASDEQRLVYAGKPLMDDHTLAQYHIQNHGAVYLVIRLPGGGSC